MSKTRDTGFLGNVIKVDASGNVSFVSGSTTLATINTTGQLSGSSPVLSSSYALNADLLDGLDSTQFTLTSSFAAQTASFTAFTSSILSFTASQNILNGTYATTGSNTFKNPQTINSNLIVTGSITAQTLIVSTINATQSYSSGSNIFGNASSNTQTFTGSLLLTGSATFNGALTAGATTLNGNLEFASGYFINMPWASDTRTMWERYYSATYFQRISSNGSLRQLRIESNGAYGNASIVLDGQSNTTVTTTITSDKFVVVGASAFTSSAASPFTLYATDGSGEGHKIQWQTAYGPNRIVADIRGNASGAGGAFIIRVADTSATLQERLTITNVGKVTIPSGANGTSYFSMNYTSSNAGSREWAIGSDTAGWGSFSIGQATTQGGSTFSDKIIITSGGAVLIGRTTSGLSNGEGVTISGGSIQPETNGYVLYGNRTSSDGLFIGIRRNNVDVGSISVTTSATAFNTSSDYRLKQDLKEFNGLSIINSIKTYDYKWKIDSSRAYGVIAHEIQEILPYVVFGEKDEINEDETIKPQAVDYSKLVPILVKAIQEQQAQINELKAQING